VARTYDLFISHSWAYSNAYEQLVGLLDKSPAFSYRNYSVPKDAPLHTNGTDADLLAAIREQVRQASCVLVMAGVYSTYSKWINKEIQVAVKEYGKPIVGIKPWNNTNVSSVVKQNADKMVAWRKASIEAAIIELVGS
jgi:hypothetical protein